MAIRYLQELQVRKWSVKSELPLLFHFEELDYLLNQDFFWQYYMYSTSVFTQVHF